MNMSLFLPVIKQLQKTHVHNSFHYTKVLYVHKYILQTVTVFYWQVLYFPDICEYHHFTRIKCGKIKKKINLFKRVPSEYKMPQISVWCRDHEIKMP